MFLLQRKLNDVQRENGATRTKKRSEEEYKRRMELREESEKRGKGRREEEKVNTTNENHKTSNSAKNIEINNMKMK